MVEASASRRGRPLVDLGLLGAENTGDLLRLYASILDELRQRGVVRSTNNPVADYAEWLTARALGLRLAGNSSAGYDAVGSDGILYQVKSRRLTKENASRQLSAIRGLSTPDADPFQFLVGVLFASDFSIGRAALIPVSVIRAKAKWMPHVNGWRFMLTDAIWGLDGVSDISDEVREAAS